jgi:hypothetical protein
MAKHTVILALRLTAGTAALMLMALALSGCGYAVGPAFDNEVHTVYV